jgi:FAD/FMN-containing dehydrogenase
MIFYLFLCFSRNCRQPVIVTDRNVSWPVDWIDWNVANSSVRAPRSVLFAHDADDVLCGLQYLLSTSTVKFNVRSGRHDYCGFSASFGAAVIDVSNLTAIDVNGHYVDVGAGVRLFELYAALESRGLMFGGGSCATVGVAGLVLGGGFGFQSRLDGMASDNLLEADVIVVVNGQPRLLTVSEHSPYADLFWSLRGGGSGSFGVVTRLRLRVTDVVPTVAIIRLAYAANLTSTLLVSGFVASGMTRRRASYARLCTKRMLQRSTTNSQFSWCCTRARRRFWL